MYADFKKAHSELSNIEKIIFGEPNTREGDVVRTHWQRLYERKDMVKQREWITNSMRQTMEKITDATRRHLDKRGATVADTQKNLETLNRYLRTVGVVGQTLKMTDSPLGVPKNANIDRASQEVMEEGETQTMKRFVDSLASINVDETVAMILEDQEFVAMLVETGAADGGRRSLKEIDIRTPNGERLSAVGADYFIRNENGEYGDYVKNPTSRELKENKVVQMPKLDPLNPRWKENYKSLVKFISGEKAENGKEKSENRRRTESVLWMEIVRNLDSAQRVKLISTYKSEKSDEEAKNFAYTCIVAGVMTKDEVGNIFTQREVGEEVGEDGKPKDKQFEANLDKAAVLNESEKRDMSKMVEQMKRGSPGNFANEFLTFNNMLWGRVGELGALTALANFIMKVADSIESRGDRPDAKGHAESVLVAGAKGARDALGEKWFWGGVAAAAGTTELMFPWMKSTLLRVSGEEEDKLLREKNKAFVREKTAENLPLENYFKKNYKGYISSAWAHKNTGGEFKIDEKDVNISAEDKDPLAEMGFGTPEEAKKVICRMFDITANGFKCGNEEKLNAFFDDLHGSTGSS